MMYECIKKQAAIDAFKPQCGDWSEAWSAEEIKQKLEAIQPVKVRPVMPEYWKETRLNSPSFCPYCGADLRGGDAE